ncbi:unnamed protein product [Kuraishia capsulata CBS 1993]|uniref:Phosphatidylglycerophosphatase GEP4, mitochondrial n=1 Tax=Kuraishia capsulata CBS 1993 TaxID=1382522 RepID=W6MJY2_9ASCO|nr:uncharacterized protein KUCA_T00000824001 [Kuraishia capsulata CBS 1993]CDK24857.1 unnamed protein product [Kuraishia capsulata CBS 1993]
MNISATLNVSKLLVKPSLAMPHLQVETFADLPVPIRFPQSISTQIKAVVLDKDNCFAKNHDDKVWPEYESKWNDLRSNYPNAQLLIVSNSAGTNDDLDHIQAEVLEKNTGVKVFRHSTKKPGCHVDIMDYFLKHKVVSGPHEVAVVGDRLFTDILMANMMGSWGVWISKGVFESQSVVCQLERQFFSKVSAYVKAVPPHAKSEKK